MKTKNKINFLPLLAAMVSLSSCVPHMYHIPSAHNVPLLKEKNECRASGSVGMGLAGAFGATASNEVQAAYAVTNHIGVFANFMSAIQEPDNGFAKESYLDAAIGYYTPIGRFGVFEFYGGMGSSRQHHGYDTYDLYGNFIHTDKVRISYVKPFFQPSIGFASNVFDIAFSARVSELFFKIGKADTVNGFKQYHDLDREFASRDIRYMYSFIEPAITLRAGWKYVKLQLQAQYSYSLDGIEHSDIFEIMHISAGLSFNLTKRFWKDALKKKD